MMSTLSVTYSEKPWGRALGCSSRAGGLWARKALQARAVFKAGPCSTQHLSVSVSGKSTINRVAVCSRPTSSRGRSTRLLVEAKQYVPSESFGGISPERAASKALRNLFTFISARIVLAQLEGSGRGGLAAYDQQAYEDLSAYLQNERMLDCDEWLAGLMRKNSGLALRLMEVRLAYAKEDFEWDNLRKLSEKDLENGNVKLMRHRANASLQAVITALDSVDLAHQETSSEGPSSSSSSNSSSSGSSTPGSSGPEPGAPAA